MNIIIIIPLFNQEVPLRFRISFTRETWHNVILSWKLWAINLDLLSVFVVVVGSSRSTKKCLLHFPDFGGVPVCGPYRLRSWDWAVWYGKHRL